MAQLFEARTGIFSRTQIAQLQAAGVEIRVNAHAHDRRRIDIIGPTGGRSSIHLRGEAEQATMMVPVGESAVAYMRRMLAPTQITIPLEEKAEANQ